jgi:stearoyl-CoA desaturase (delta-9 desaturase)
MYTPNEPDDPAAPRRPASTLAASGGRRSQRLHASMIVLLPAIALAGAAWALAAHAVQAWHLAVLAGMSLLTILAITVGFHRLLTHRAFKTGPVLRAILTIAGCMAAQGPPLYWVGNHRLHHRYVERDGDPHSPWTDKGRALSGWNGFWHAHVGWTLGHDLVNSIDYCPDLLQDRVVRWVGRHYFMWVLLGLLLPGAVGWALEGTLGAVAAGCFWGGPVRLFFTYHLTNANNSAAHIWGYQRYPTGDSSRNNWFLGIFTLGEGWHNNHHADASAAVFSRAWYEIDIGGAVILMLAWCRLAHEVRRPRAERDGAS